MATRPQCKTPSGSYNNSTKFGEIFTGESFVIGRYDGFRGLDLAIEPRLHRTALVVGASVGPGRGYRLIIRATLGREYKDQA